MTRSQDRVAPRRSWFYHLAVLLLHLCLSAPVSPPAASPISPLPAHSARSSGLQLRRDGQRSREAAGGGEGGSGLPPPGRPVRSLRPDDAAQARGALDADADSEAATGAGVGMGATDAAGGTEAEVTAPGAGMRCDFSSAIFSCSSF